MPDKPDTDKPVFKLMPDAKINVEENICPTCKKPIGVITSETFKDRLSEKEYSISGMCQECQDGIFG